MNKKAQAVLASCVLAGSVILTGVMIYLAVVFPRRVAVWADQGKQLSSGEMLMVNLSNMVTTFGLPLLGLLMLLGVASLIWLVVALGAMRKDSANTASHGTLAGSRP